MAETKGTTFRKSILISGLVTRERVDQAVAEMLSEQGRSAPRAEVSDEMLADRLVELGVLTRYQADQLMVGRTKLTLGPYIVTDWIAQGGMGQVFKVVHSIMGRQCAVKVLPLNKSTPEAIDNFTREIRTQAQLDHPNLVRAYDAGHDGNVHYLVTEYVEGTDLRRLVRSQGPLTMQQAASVMMQAAQALEYAHQRNLIHRDVKPGNILVRPDSMVKVSDLGLAGFVKEAEMDPRAAKIVGTADYLSPEQILTPAEITATSDIYSLGCTLYYAICAKVPFPGGTPSSKARRHLEETPWHPRRFNPDINEEFVEIIADMMEKDPAERIQTAAEVISRLEPWATDASPIAARQLTKSPWLAPPLPTGEDSAGDTDVGLGVAGSESSQSSEGTFALASASQETKRVRSQRNRRQPPLLARTEPSGQPAPKLSGPQAVLLALIVAVPMSIAVGVVIGLLLAALFR